MIVRGWRMLCLLPALAACQARGPTEDPVASVGLADEAGLCPAQIQDPGEQIRVLHWNLAGAISACDVSLSGGFQCNPTKTDNRGRLEVVDRLISLIELHRPDVVSVNEVCHSQFDHLVQELRRRGFFVGGGFTASRPEPPPID